MKKKKKHGFLPSIGMTGIHETQESRRQGANCTIKVELEC